MPFDDNIMKGVQSWEFPYRFIIGRKSKWDDSVEILGWTGDPEAAYMTYIELLTESSNDLVEITLWDYFLHDSFHIDAIDFCRDAYEKAAEA